MPPLPRFVAAHTQPAKPTHTNHQTNTKLLQHLTRSFIRHSYRTAVEDVPPGDYTIPLGSARTVREGGDVTLVGWGAQVLVLEEAARRAAALAEPISCEVLDLRTLLPWDAAAVEASVNRTGRLVVSHEAPLTGHFGAEVAARVAERCFLRLEAPPLRVTGADTPFPLAYEPVYLPGVDRVLEAVRRVASY